MHDYLVCLHVPPHVFPPVPSPVCPPVCPPVSSPVYPSVCLFNTRSLANKLSKFQSLVYASDFNVFCITETWLSEKSSDDEILPSSFVLYRCDRPFCGGEALIAVHKSLPSTLISSPSDLEVVVVKLGLVNEIVICCVYVPPDCIFVYLISDQLPN